MGKEGFSFLAISSPCECRGAACPPLGLLHNHSKIDEKGLWLVGQIEIHAEDIDGQLWLDAGGEAARLGSLAHAAVRVLQFAPACLRDLVQMWAQLFDVHEQAAQELTRQVFRYVAIRLGF